MSEIEIWEMSKVVPGTMVAWVARLVIFDSARSGS